METILWIDDMREPPNDTDYIWLKSVNEAKQKIIDIENGNDPFGYTEIALIDIDHDAGDYAHDGGDYIRLLDWLEETGKNYPIKIHSMNTVGRQNMRAIIRHNKWTEIQ